VNDLLLEYFREGKYVEQAMYFQFNTSDTKLKQILTENQIQFFIEKINKSPTILVDWDVEKLFQLINQIANKDPLLLLKIDQPEQKQYQQQAPLVNQQLPSQDLPPVQNNNSLDCGKLLKVLSRRSNKK
jgi:excinuclease UvrABC nuclease subunit